MRFGGEPYHAGWGDQLSGGEYKVKITVLTYRAAYC